MSKEQDDRGVDPESEEIFLTEHGREIHRMDHILDATGRRAAPEDDSAGD